VIPQFGASLTGDSGVVIYDHNMFIIQTTARDKQSSLFGSGLLVPEGH